MLKNGKSGVETFITVVPALIGQHRLAAPLFRKSQVLGEGSAPSSSRSYALLLPLASAGVGVGYQNPRALHFPFPIP